MISEVTDAAPVPVDDLYRRLSVVRIAVYAIFLPDMLQGQGTFPFKKIGGHRTRSRFKQIRKILFMADLPAKIQLCHVAVRQHSHDITDSIIV